MPRIPVLSYRRAGAKRRGCQGLSGALAGKSARSYLTHCAAMTQSRRAHPRFTGLFRGCWALLLAALLLGTGAAQGAESAAASKVSAPKAHIHGTDITAQFNALYNGPEAK